MPSPQRDCRRAPGAAMAVRHCESCDVYAAEETCSWCGADMAAHAPPMTVSEHRHIPDGLNDARQIVPEPGGELSDLVSRR
jgi:hypothetical protein